MHPLLQACTGLDRQFFMQNLLKKKVLHAESSRKTRMKMHSRGDGSDGDYYGPLKKKMENTMVETKKNARIL